MMCSCLKTPPMNQLRGKLLEACISPVVSSDKNMAGICLEAKERQQMPSRHHPFSISHLRSICDQSAPKENKLFALNQWPQTDICKPRNELIASVHSEQTCCWSSPTAPKHRFPRALLTETTRELQSWISAQFGRWGLCK